MVFADAYDVLATGSPMELLAKYRAFNARVVFGGEKGCWPFIQFPIAEVKEKVHQCFDVFFFVCVQLFFRADYEWQANETTQASPADCGW